jgi:uncharacterized protein YecE (DUF72 family)
LVLGLDFAYNPRVATSHRGQVRIGCAGWNYKQWKAPVYDGAPQRLWLTRYAERFGTVEVNSTFYRLPLESTVKTWAEQTPDGFLFAVKVGRYLTHIKRLAPPKSGGFTMLERLAPIVEAGKLGPLLWQLPPAFKRDDERLADAMRRFPSGHRHAIEFRHPSWFCEPVMDAMRAVGVALVIGDHPERDFQTHQWTTDWTYIRLNHGKAGVDERYSPAELKAWATRIADWRERGDVYAYFNSDEDVFAVRDGEALRELLDR